MSGRNSKTLSFFRYHNVVCYCNVRASMDAVPEVAAATTSVAVIVTVIVAVAVIVVGLFG